MTRYAHNTTCMLKGGDLLEAYLLPSEGVLASGLTRFDLFPNYDIAGTRVPFAQADMDPFHLLPCYGSIST